MSYTFSKTIQGEFNEVIDKVTDSLKADGFGIVTDIDMAATLKNKLEVDMRKYRILGACSPSFAHKAVQMEENVGTMLPCNIVVQETKDGVRVSAINPVASMMAIPNQKLKELAGQVGEKLQNVIERI